MVEILPQILIVYVPIYLVGIKLGWLPKRWLPALGGLLLSDLFVLFANIGGVWPPPRHIDAETGYRLMGGKGLAVYYGVMIAASLAALIPIALIHSNKHRAA